MEALAESLPLQGRAGQRTDSMRARPAGEHMQLMPAQGPGSCARPHKHAGQMMCRLLQTHPERHSLESIDGDGAYGLAQAAHHRHMEHHQKPEGRQAGGHT